MDVLDLEDLELLYTVSYYYCSSFTGQNTCFHVVTGAVNSEKINSLSCENTHNE